MDRETFARWFDGQVAFTVKDRANPRTRFQLVLQAGTAITAVTDHMGPSRILFTRLIVVLCSVSQVMVLITRCAKRYKRMHD